ncbi:MAG: hypothetical protein KGI47_10085, partial [Betaproteobacteria bacterium]|nr:hypothetical protein [Betaproteobacteria bacterium]
MKLIIQNGRISATATDAYVANGTEQAVITAPSNYTQADMGYYVYANGTLTLNTAQQTYDMLIAGGITLTSTVTPALNGTYSTNETAQKNISGIVTGIAASLGLPGGGTTFQYQDATGAFHT